MKYILLIIFLLPSLILKGQSFQDWVDTVSSKPPSQRQPLVDSFMAAQNQFPFIENDTTVHFIYQGFQSSISVPGDHNFWDPNADALTQIIQTDFWYATFHFEPNARVDYKFVLNGSSWITDPLNPNLIYGGFGPNSELAMPQYIQPWEINSFPNTIKGKVVTHSVRSDIMNRNYDVRFYLPYGYDTLTAKRYPAVYFQDGGEYLNLADAQNILDNLIDSALIPPVIGVFVTPTDRNNEYAFNRRDDYRMFFANELVPFVDSLFKTYPDPGRRTLVGTSFGANISTLIGFNHPDKFSNLGLHSPAIWPNNFEAGWLAVGANTDTIKQAMVWGSLEGGLHQDILFYTDTLLFLGFDVYSQFQPEGHSWGLWRATLDDLLIYLLPSQILGIDDPKGSGFSVYPNPAVDQIKLMSTSSSFPAFIEIIDLVGRVRLETELRSPDQRIDISMLERGVYLLRNGSNSLDPVRFIKN